MSSLDDADADELGHFFSIDFVADCSDLEGAGFFAFFLKGRGVNSSVDELELSLSSESISNTSTSSLRDIFCFDCAFGFGFAFDVAFCSLPLSFL